MLTHLFRRSPVAPCVAGDGGDEGLLLECVEPHVGSRRDGRRPRHVSKQGDLPEPLAATPCLPEDDAEDLADLPQVAAHRGSETSHKPHLPAGPFVGAGTQIVATHDPLGT